MDVLRDAGSADPTGCAGGALAGPSSGRPGRQTSATDDRRRPTSRKKHQLSAMQQRLNWWATDGATSTPDSAAPETACRVPDR